MQKNSEQATHHEQSEQRSDNVALYFYSIILFSFVLPVVIAVCVVFVNVPVQIILWIAGLLLVGGLAYVYVKIFRQARALQQVVEHLNEMETDTEINLLGGLFRIMIEHDTRKALPPPIKVKEVGKKQAGDSAVSLTQWPDAVSEGGRDNGRSLDPTDARNYDEDSSDEVCSDKRKPALPPPEFRNK
ncbi:MAG: hypothetical protein WCA08_05345 [Desulfoferrobacter sp.]